jgi:hypothetical protein
LKKTRKLEINKVTLQNLDEPKLEAMAGAGTGGAITCYVTCLCSQLACITKSGSTCVKD